MSGSFSSVVWLCAALAALPASPCRLIGGIDANPRAAVSETDSCCAQHAAAKGKSPASSPQSPCPRQCCKVGPAIPAIHGSAVDVQLATPPVAFLLVPAIEAEGAATFCEPISFGRSLQILHCRWLV